NSYRETSEDEFFSFTPLSTVSSAGLHYNYETSVFFIVILIFRLIVRVASYSHYGYI
ncbi:Uncharacterized protein APZ42_004770, partial [Daphnia magna]